MACLRPSTQSIAAYRSSSSHPDTPSTWPSELVAVSARNPRANASFEAGAITWATNIASTRSRRRDGAGSISSGRPSRAAVPSTAATCPCGTPRGISNASARSSRGGKALAALAVALPQQDRRRRPPIRHPRHIHGYFIAQETTRYCDIPIRHAARTCRVHDYNRSHIWTQNTCTSTQTRVQTRPTRGNFGLSVKSRSDLNFAPRGRGRAVSFLANEADQFLSRGLTWFDAPRREGPVDG